MRTIKRSIRTNGLSLRAVKLVSLGLIVWASWSAPTGHTSSRTGSPLSAHKASPSALSKHSGRGSQTAWSTTDSITPDGLNIWITGGPEGGSIRSLAIDPTNPATVYAGTERRGVFKTINSGASWSQVNTGLTDLSVYELVIDSSNSNTLYANTSSGIMKSTNGGASWNPSNNGLSSSSLRPLVIDPSHPNILYVGTFSSSIFKSVDGGASWVSSGEGLGYPIVHALAIAPGNSKILYAGTGSNGRFSGGVFKSTDGGSSWHAVGKDHRTVHALAIDPSNPNTVYGSTFDGLIKSTDGGDTWNESNHGLPTGIYSDPPIALVIDPSNPNTIYAGFLSSRDFPFGGAGLFKSRDGGATWQPISDGLSGDVMTVAIDRSSSSTIYAGSNRGVFKSTNGALNWSAVTRGMDAVSVRTLAVAHANTMYAGTDLGVFKSTDGGTSWSASGLNPSAFGLPSYEGVSGLVLDPNNSDTIYACISGAGHGVFKSIDGGASWVFKRSAASFLEDGGFFAMAIDPINSNIIYASGFANYYDNTYYFVEKSNDGGENWTEILNNQTGPLLVDSDNPNTIYLGLWHSVGKSIDGGATWNYFTNGLPASSINQLALDPGNSNTIYAATGHQGYEQDHDTGVFKSTDGGESWNGVGPSAIVLALAIDPSQPKTIYAGTLGKGVFKTTDGGESWSSFNTGLTNLTVAALALDGPGTELHAATPGGIFSYRYALDCAYSLSATGQSFSTDSAIGSVRVTTSIGCNWQASSSASWITINSGSDGSGDGIVNFSVAANPEANPRTGTLTIAKQKFIVNQSGPAPLNPIDDAQFFVRRHYLDFLNREPDQNGLAFWVREIVSCGGNAECIEVKRINVSAAYFLSTEFQDTGFYVLRTQRAAFGRKSDTAATRYVYLPFLNDAQQVGAGVVVGQPGAEALLEANKQAYATQIVTSAAFITAYPLPQTASQYVDALFATATVSPTTTERNAAITAFGDGGTSGRVAALRSVVESNSIKSAEFNPAFVLMEYYGYLRRNPTDPPDNNDAGYQFWLTKLNSFGGNFINAEMVKAFITCAEYRKRFGTP
jgi:photosystem II stability/assembly factor-like uncharacterized protein